MTDDDRGIGRQSTREPTAHRRRLPRRRPRKDEEDGGNQGRQKVLCSACRQDKLPKVPQSGGRTAPSGCGLDKIVSCESIQKCARTEETVHNSGDPAGRREEKFGGAGIESRSDGSRQSAVPVFPHLRTFSLLRPEEMPSSERPNAETDPLD